MNISESKEWKNLERHYELDLKHLNINDLFNISAVNDNSQKKELGNKNRFESLSFDFDQLWVDFSKQKLNEKTLTLLLKLADSVELKKAIHQMASGQLVNTTEERSALHMALRLNKKDTLIVNKKNINLNIQQELQTMDDMVNKLTAGEWRGHNGKPITDVVNLGVGGSDLGPLLVCHALDDFSLNENDVKNLINVHFASTMDGSQLSVLFEKLNPETTLFVIVSKSFSTIDTLSNALSAKNWLLKEGTNESHILQHHFIGISTDEAKMREWGIPPEHQLKLWDWVGGRFSLWSTVGLTIALKVGMNNFKAFLKGANEIDKHFLNTDFKNNIPVLLGLIGVWNTNFLNNSTHAILPYDARLKYFPDYLTQLEMESNGKSVTHNGNKLNFQTCPVLLGEVGPNAQHAFYQLLHQGTRKVSSDFIAPINRFTKVNNKHEQSLYQQHLLTLANCFAQSSALMLGNQSSKIEECDDDSLSNHQQYPGNQPSTTILISELSPYSLGQLIALYEHKVFVMATIWGINAFDQWGVELGKKMAEETLQALKTEQLSDNFDESTNGLINLIKRHNFTSKDKAE